MSSAEHETLLEVDGLVTRYPVQRGVVGAIARRPKETVHAVEGVSFTIACRSLIAETVLPATAVMMVPALISSPAYDLTPRRFDSESRPLRELPCPFL